MSTTTPAARTLTIDDLAHALIWETGTAIVCVECTDRISDADVARRAAVLWWEHCTNDRVDAAAIRDLGYFLLCQDPYDLDELRPARPGELPDYRIWAFDLASALRR